MEYMSEKEKIAKRVEAISSYCDMCIEACEGCPMVDTCKRVNGSHLSMRKRFEWLPDLIEWLEMCEENIEEAKK